MCAAGPPAKFINFLSLHCKVCWEQYLLDMINQRWVHWYILVLFRADLCWSNKLQCCYGVWKTKKRQTFKRWARTWSFLLWWTASYPHSYSSIHLTKDPDYLSVDLSPFLTLVGNWSLSIIDCVLLNGGWNKFLCILIVDNIFTSPSTFPALFIQRRLFMYYFLFCFCWYGVRSI